MWCQRVYDSKWILTWSNALRFMSHTSPISSTQRPMQLEPRLIALLYFPSLWIFSYEGGFFCLLSNALNLMKAWNLSLSWTTQLLLTSKCKPVAFQNLVSYFLFFLMICAMITKRRDVSTDPVWEIQFVNSFVYFFPLSSNRKYAGHSSVLQMNA